MTITYELGDSLYINITNCCTNNCLFCIRNISDGVGSGTNLWLEQEPSIDEVIEDIQRRDIAKYKEFVFCGFGEPMMRAYDIIEICKKLKEKYCLPIRINTNGHANLICGRDITPQLQGLVDAVSISMNAGDRYEYQAICRSKYGEAAFEAMLDFAVKCKEHIPKVVMTVVNSISGENIRNCKELAQSIGAEFRVRYYVKQSA